MTRAHLIFSAGAAIACVLGGCMATTPAAATTPAQPAAAPDSVRDVDGNLLPPYALDDSTEPAFTVHCEDGRSYAVAVDRSLDLYRPGPTATVRMAEPGGDDAMCRRIRAASR